MALIERKPADDEVTKYVATAARTAAAVLSILASTSAVATIILFLFQQPLIAGACLLAAVVFTAWRLIHIYRRRKNAAVQRVFAVSTACKYLAERATWLLTSTPEEGRAALTYLLYAFQAIHDCDPRSPDYGWQVALWAPNGPKCLRIIASVNVGRTTENRYLMGDGSAPGTIDGLVWKAWIEKQDLHSTDAQSDDRVDTKEHKKHQNPERRSSIGSIFCKLVCLDERSVGVISINNRQTGLFFEDEADARAAIAGLVAICMKLTDNVTSSSEVST